MHGLGLLDPIVRIFGGGSQLPLLHVLSLMGPQYGEYFRLGTCPVPWFILTGAIPRGGGPFPGTGNSSKRPSPCVCQTDPLGLLRASTLSDWAS